MKFKNFEWRIVLRVAFLLITLSLAAFILVKQWYVYLLLAVPVIMYQVIEFYRFHHKAYTELEQF
ncbi:MAG TPA: ATP-binding protein, partial [Chitinophagaceae bacterium]|nr:ATP-binding protein [Chitinophagaceae bacterium]